MANVKSDIRRGLISVFWGLLLWLAPAAWGQDGATLSGVVTDRSTGRPIQNAQIILLTDSRSVVTDTAGQFRLTKMPFGPSQLLVRALGFPAKRVIVDLTGGQEIVRPVLLDSTAFGRVEAAQTLPSVDVSAVAPILDYRMVSFEERRKTGRGQYLTEEQIVSSGAFNLADAVKNLRGVTYECGGGAGCFIRMTRAPARCLPEFIVDDHENNDFGLYTPIRDIVGLEVYSGPADVPGEYAGRNSGCGVVVIWTRSGPTRKRR